MKMTEEIKCKYCGKYFTKRNKKHEFCCSTCKRKFHYENNIFHIECSNCKKIFERNVKKKSKDSFCSKECENEFKFNKYNEERNCDICGTSFYCLKSSKRKYCSLKCQIEWQKRNPITGKNHQSYNHDISDDDRTISCQWCGNDFIVPPYKIGVAKFCSKFCRQEWFSKVWSQSEEWKKNRSVFAANQIKNSVKSQSSIQIKINNILSEMNIGFENEKVYDNFSVDNYLIDYNLIIEVMGTFWHCDIRKYKTIEYENQKMRIKMDKIKNTILVKNYNVPVLYLWEKDIENTQLCKAIIRYFVENGGDISNFHSCNYFINKNNLSINNYSDIVVPYMDWNIKDINSIVPPDRKEKMSKRQKDKWTTFKCEVCGKEKEELTSHYIKSKHHFCSYGCSNEYKKSS